MPEAIKAALTTELAIRHPSSAIIECPKDIQYMPPGTHRINASRGGKPVTLDITVDASTAETLNKFLQAQLTKAQDGSDDRPFFDFNHEDREAAAWPTEFYWAGDDLKTGGVRAKVEWSGAGQSAVKDKTFRRFSPTFVPDEAGHVVGSETNMGGLVNRAAFKSIQPLFAKDEQRAESIHEARQRVDGPRASVGPEGVTKAGALRAPKEQPLFAKGETPGPQISRSASASSSDPCPSVSISGSKNTSASAPNPSPSSSAPSANSAVKSSSTMTIKAKLHTLKIIDSVEASDESAVEAVEAKFTELQSRIDTLEAEQTAAIEARATSQIESAVKAGRISPADTDAKAFWQDALIRDEAKAAKALDALPVNPVLAKVTDGDDPKNGLLDKMHLQQKKLAEVQAANPQADFQTIFSKAQAEAPDLFR